MPQIPFNFELTFTVDMARVVAFAFSDPTNKSIHLHLYSEIFPKGRKPIQIKNIDSEFPLDKQEAAIKRIIGDLFPNQKVEIGGITIKETKSRPDVKGPVKRVIARFR